MIYTEHRAAEGFLALAQSAIERQECANALMLGIALRLVREPNAYGSQPYLATVESAEGIRVAAVMTPPHRLQLYTPDDSNFEGLGSVADALLKGKWPVPGVMAREAVAQTFASIWSRKTGSRCRTGMRQRIHELREVVPPPQPCGEFAQAIDGNLELVRRWACGFHQDCFGDGRPDLRHAEELLRRGDLFLWVDGDPKSMAARTRPTPHGQCISLVYTPPEYRRRGYATALVARLSQRILDGGKQFCTLYTNLSNATSNSIYRSIGYRGVADVIDVHFEAESGSHQVQPNS